MRLSATNLSILLAFFGATTPVTAQDPTLLRNINTFARYATAAYCQDLTDGSIDSKVCSNPQAGACGDLADATTVTEFGTTQHTISGNIAVSNSQKLIVLSFRGTDVYSVRDVMSDLKLCPREPKTIGGGLPGGIKAVCAIFPSTPPDENDPVLPLCQNCLVHTGFWTAFRGIKSDMMTVIREQQRRHPDFAVVATGHSLGGAVASIAGAYLRKSGITTDIYTYGSPRIGDDFFTTFISSQTNGKTIRVTNMADPVTVMPGIIAGFAHTTPEYWFPDGLGRPETMKTCEGVTTLACSAQFNVRVSNMGDHSGAKYTNGFNACPARGPRNADPDMADAITEQDIEEWKEIGLVDNTTVATGQ